MPEKDIDIANRLKTLRDERNISQRQLAKKSNVSNAAISLIENNKTNPSLGLLKKILDAVPISISDFFAMNVSEQEPYNSFILRISNRSEIVDIACNKSTCHRKRNFVIWSVLDSGTISITIFFNSLSCLNLQ